MIVNIKRKCRHCRRLFVPDPRNAWHQQFCAKPACRKASKRTSQKRWLQKPQNQNYFCDPCHVDRVRRWRRDHPKRPRPQPANRSNGYKNTDNKNNIADQQVKQKSDAVVLQDLLTPQYPIIIGLISHLSASVLQDDIATTTGRLRQLGLDILNPQTKGVAHDCQTPHCCPQGP